MNSKTAVVHEAGRRLRLRFAPGVDAIDLRLRVDQMEGVESVRMNKAARSLVVRYDGRANTRNALLAETARESNGAGTASATRRVTPRLSLPKSLVGAALAAALPQPGRSAAALALVAGKTAVALRAGSEASMVALDAISLATTTLTGHPLTAATSVVLSTVAQHWRDSVLSDTDLLLAHLVPEEDSGYTVARYGRRREMAAAEIAAGDLVRLQRGQVVPVDGIVEDGFDTNARLYAGDRVNRSMQLRAERDAAHSRSARLRAHIRHALLARDPPGPLPAMEGVLALPVAAASLVLALTKDTGRTASMIQLNPHYAFALAYLVARDAALYAAARHGALMSGLDSIERLAIGQTFAFQDVGVLTDPYWHVGRIDVTAGVDAQDVRLWLAQLVGSDDVARLEAGVADSVVDGWLDHGAVLAHPDGALHVAGSAVLERTWKLPRTQADRRSLSRWIGIVRNGQLLARVQLESRLRATIKQHFDALRALGAQRIAVFTENPYEASAAQLHELGADAVVAGDRAQQAAWLASEVQNGRPVVLVHTSMRDVLPPGGLSLCPSTQKRERMAYCWTSPC